MTDFSPTNDPANDSAPAKRAHEPLLNIPPATLALTCILTACFIGWYYFGAFFDPIMIHMVFIPAAFTHDPVMQSYTLLSYAFLHFNWAHLLMNGTGLLAFGSGIERLMGKRYLIGIFLGGAIAGVLGYWLFYIDGNTPLIGASAGISALFGALLPVMVKRTQILVASILFILVNIVLGMMGMPDDPMRQSTAGIAWQAHIAGFLFGEFLTLGILRWKFMRYKAAQKSRL